MQLLTLLLAIQEICLSRQTYFLLQVIMPAGVSLDLIKDDSDYGLFKYQR